MGEKEAVQVIWERFPCKDRESHFGVSGLELEQRMLPLFKAGEDGMRVQPTGENAIKTPAHILKQPPFNTLYLLLTPTSCQCGRGVMVEVVGSLSPKLGCLD